ncbi:ABC transporter ATP-binding protein [Vibrio rhizosphaerae]|uniref:ABC transporter ATP-binding protein n=1 Tax=Vibrio rhizosphaerae TaxID=398736 RepID=A0ABU4IWW2_9VIBR|nr:ABC transporter ATP-binding protein [Vibrio rhizosphaerae]MDW6093901.1 ABC transporter ATP-binding protein [Vibrio rhizosphaerae]
MIEFRSVSFTYPGSDVGVHDISLSVNNGELLAILGKSGCGKTTLLKLLAGFEQPSSGQVIIHHQDQSGIPCSQRRLGIVFQDYALFPHYNVLKNVMYPLKINKTANAREKAMAMIELVGLGGMENRMPHQLSGGQKQRVALARALVFEPQALLLDEPLSALDASLRQEMRDEIVKIQKTLNITTFLITHDQEEAMSMADQVAVMENGRIQQCGQPLTIYHHPNSVAVARFVGKANILSGTTAQNGLIKTALGDLRLPQTDLMANQSVQLVIRPEQIIAAPDTTTPNQFAVEAIEQQQFLGHTMAYRLRVSGQPLDVYTPYLTTPLTRIAIPAESVHVIENGDF